MNNYKSNIEFIRISEGGISDSQKDLARHNPSPCGVGTRGYPIHTNKGITWTTFKSCGSGFNRSCENFLKMPDYIWENIYKTCYWDAMKANEIKSQVIADFITAWAWGSGVGGAKNSLYKYYEKKGNPVTNYAEAINRINEDIRQNERKLFTELVEHREAFYRGLNQPANLSGWLRRLNDFYESRVDETTSGRTLSVVQFGKPNPQKSTKNLLFVPLLLLILGVAFTLLYRYRLGLKQ